MILELCRLRRHSLRRCAVLKPEVVVVVVVDVLESGRDAAGQLIVAQMQVPRISQAAQLRRYLAGQSIVVEPQMLQAVEPSQIRWYRASEVFGCLNQSGGPAVRPLSRRPSWRWECRCSSSASRCL